MRALWSWSSIDAVGLKARLCRSAIVASALLAVAVVFAGGDAWAAGTGTKGWTYYEPDTVGYDYTGSPSSACLLAPDTYTDT